MLSDKLDSMARAIDVFADVGPMDPRMLREVARTLRGLVERAEALENAAVPMRCRGPLPEGVVSITGRRRPGAGVRWVRNEGDGGDAA
jgi:hypothetical protein